MNPELRALMQVWQVRVWDVVTVGAMLTVSVLGALWMVRLG